MTLTKQALAATAVRKFARLTIDDGVIHSDDTDLGDHPHVRIQTITDDEIDQYEQIPYDQEGKFQASRIRLRRRKLQQLCLIDNDGKRLYEPKELLEIKMGGGISKTIQEGLLEFTGLEANLSKRITVDDAKKNSSATGDSDSPTESASDSESMTPNSGIDPSNPMP